MKKKSAILLSLAALALSIGAVGGARLRPEPIF